MSSTKYLVSTAMGDTLLDPTDYTYVQVTRDRFVRKSSGDLRPGDLVLFAKPFASTDLEDVDPYLTKSPRYATAKEMIHETNSRGNYIPKLRTLLIRGLANQGVINRENLDSMILFESGNDFTPEEYKTMEERLFNVLTIDGQPRMSRSGIRNWLEGSVLAPRDWSLLQTLSRKLNPEFSSFEYGSGEPTSMYFNYRLYVTIRQGVMRYLNQAKGKSSEEGWNEAENIISLTPEYQIVFSHFLKDLSISYASARVNNVTRMQKRRQIEYARKTNRFLGEGIVRESPRIKLSLKSFPELIEDEEILLAYLHAAVEDFDSDPLEFHDGRRITLTPLMKYSLSVFAVPLLLEHFGEGLDSRMETIKMESMSGILYMSIPAAERTDFCNKIKDAILFGEMDSFFGYERGTMLSLSEAHFRTRTTIPSRVWDFLNFAKNHALDVTEGRVPQDESDIRRRLRREIEKLEELYGLKYDQMGYRINAGGFFSWINLHPELRGITMSPREHLDSLTKDRDAFLREIETVNKFMKDNPESFLRTRKHTRDILRQYGLSHILNLRKQDFYFEEVS
ncbi:MAG: hypothetical protein HYW24_05465 [Candidatus Aenigmarchaeota archaeon]|nr:hypothetical protein [Candidatus Aenigmarchaeota archaeon]